MYKIDLPWKPYIPIYVIEEYIDAPRYRVEKLMGDEWMYVINAQEEVGIIRAYDYESQYYQPNTTAFLSQKIAKLVATAMNKKMKRSKNEIYSF